MLYAGLDIGGTNARLEIFDDSLTTVASDRRPVRDATSPLALAQRIAAMLQESKVDGSLLQGIGIGLAGQMSADGKMVFNAPNLGWRNVAFASILADVLGGFSKAPIALANDLNALLWGEYRFGAARGAREALAVFVGTGVGGAVLSNGQLVQGAGGKAGEIGHVKVAIDGPQCGCGEFGCLEAFAGGIHLERVVSRLGRYANLAEADAQAFDDPAVRAIWNRVTTHLGLSIANAVTLLNPEVVVLGGGILENLDNFRTLTLQRTTPLILSACRDDVRFEMGQLKDRAGVIGAALLAKES